MCTPCLLEGRSTDPRSTAESFCCLESPGRPGRSTSRELCSLFQAAVDRAGRPRLQRSEFWPLAVDRAGRQSAARAEKLPQRLVFLSLYKEGFWGCFKKKILSEFLHQFFLLFQEVFFTYIWAKYFHSKGEFIKSFQKWFSCVFTIISILVFSQTLELSIAISTYRSVIVRVFIGDQSV